jgi:hypothetical protein
LPMTGRATMIVAVGSGDSREREAVVKL